MPTLPTHVVIQAAQRAAHAAVARLRQLQAYGGSQFLFPPLDFLLEHWLESSPFRPWRARVQLALPYFLGVRPSRGVQLSGCTAGCAHEVVLKLTAQLHGWMSQQAAFGPIALHLNNRFLDCFGAASAQWRLACERLSIALWVPPDQKGPLLDQFTQTEAANQRAGAFYEGVDDLFQRFESDRRWRGKTFVEEVRVVSPEGYHALAAALAAQVADFRLDALERQLRWEASRALLKFREVPVDRRGEVSAPSLGNPTTEVRTTSAVTPPILHPRWDRERRELWYGERLLKRYRRPAPHQEAILSAFQEEGWPSRIDDPLKPGKRKDALQGLNSALANQPLQFEGDGTGEGILWKISS
jgi:hypothetical protein